MIRLLFMLASAGLVSACAGTPPAPPSASGTLRPAALSSVPAEGLPAQNLAPGECGLFLWEKSAPRRFVFFTRASSADALVLLDGEARNLLATEAAGNVFGQFLTETRYSDRSRGISVSLKIQPGEVLEGGQRVDDGFLLSKNAEGWETILPITGVRACMPG
jgi:hypothetical protein